MRNFFKKTGRPKDLIKSLSLPVDRPSDCDGRTAADGDSSVAATICHRTAHHTRGDTDNASLRAAEQFCDSQNDDFWQRRQHLYRPILRIVTDRECLAYFVQYLDTKSALPLIKFWIDADSFKASADVCGTPSATSTCEWRWRSPLPRWPQSSSSIHSDASPHRRVLSKSASLNIGAERVSDSCSICDPDDVLSLSAYSETIDHELGDHTTDDQPRSTAKRDVGDGSSQTNSMNEICDPVYRTKCQLSGDDDASATAAASPSPCKHDINATPIRLRNVHADLVTDAKRIFHKYLIGLNAPYRVEVPAAILSEITIGLGRSVDESTVAGITAIASIFVEAQQYVLTQLEIDYLDAFLESSFYHCYCTEMLTGDAVHIADILYNEAALFYFMEFVEQENQREYFDFWISAAHFRRQFANDAYDTAQAQSDALVLYEKFFSLQATQSLHLSDSIRFGVEERICAESGRIGDCFDVPLAIVERYFEQRYLPPFVKSSLFERFIAELRRKTDDHLPRAATADAVDGDANAPTTITARGHRKSNSDCSSDQVQHVMRRSISSQNTLLAVDGSKKRRAANALRPPPGDTNMLIDARQLQDPDMLWRRNTIPGLSFGRIDELGRYLRNYETAPVRTNGIDAGGLATSSRLKQAVRKLVNLREDSVQQEVAWQVAEMIVKEITSVTLNGSAGPESQL